jgi:hypothetical protein
MRSVAQLGRLGGVFCPGRKLIFQSLEDLAQSSDLRLKPVDARGEVLLEGRSVIAQFAGERHTHFIAAALLHICAQRLFLVWDMEIDDIGGVDDILKDEPGAPL